MYFVKTAYLNCKKHKIPISPGVRGDQAPLEIVLEALVPHHSEESSLWLTVLQLNDSKHILSASPSTQK